MPSYEAEIPESQRKDSDIISVKAKSFADREIRYTLKAQGQGAGTFNIGPSSGIVKLAKELDFEDLRQPHIYQLLVTATEDSGGFSTSVELTIRVSDVNDNAPKFELPDYQAHNIDEDIAIGTSILKVKASDADSGSNADIAYSVSDDHFAVDSDGLISNNRRLDADSNNAYYEFQVTSKDKGEPARTGTATVRIYTENKNDEEPRFSQQVYTPNVDENAGPNTLVTTVVASDKVHAHGANLASICKSHKICNAWFAVSLPDLTLYPPIPNTAPPLVRALPYLETSFCFAPLLIRSLWGQSVSK